MPNILHSNQFMKKANQQGVVSYFPPIGQEIAQGLQDSKTSNLNCSYEALVQKEALTIWQDRVFASFLYVL